jgi:hypothetical protein
MDDNSRFWISSIVSQRREVMDARLVYQGARSKINTPKALVHD